MLQVNVESATGSATVRGAKLPFRSRSQDALWMKLWISMVGHAPGHKSRQAGINSKSGKIKSDSAGCTSEVHSMACGIEVILHPGFKESLKAHALVVCESLGQVPEWRRQAASEEDRVAIDTVRTDLKRDMTDKISAKHDQAGDVMWSCGTLTPGSSIPVVVSGSCILPVGSTWSLIGRALV